MNPVYRFLLHAFHIIITTNGICLVFVWHWIGALIRSYRRQALSPFTPSTRKTRALCLDEGRRHACSLSQSAGGRKRRSELAREGWSWSRCHRESWQQVPPLKRTQTIECLIVLALLPRTPKNCRRFQPNSKSNSTIIDNSLCHT